MVTTLQPHRLVTPLRGESLLRTSFLMSAAAGGGAGKADDAEDDITRKPPAGFYYFGQNPPSKDSRMVLPYGPGADKKSNSINYNSMYYRVNDKQVRCLLPKSNGEPCHKELSDEKDKGLQNVVKHFKSEHKGFLMLHHFLEVTKPKVSTNPANQPTLTSYGVKPEEPRPEPVDEAAPAESAKTRLIEAFGDLCSQYPLPFSAIESPVVRNFLVIVGQIQPKLEDIPARRSVQRATDASCKSILESAAQDFHSRAAVKVSVTLDGGQASGSRGIFGLLAHSMDDDGKLLCLPLACAAFVGSHTAEAYRVMTKTVLDKVDLQSRMYACVHDSASNVCAAFHVQVDLVSLPCIVHIVNLVVKYTYDNKAIAPLYKAATDLCDFFAHSTKLNDALRAAQVALLSEVCLRVYSDVPTRFLSKLLQILRLIDLAQAIQYMIDHSTEKGSIYNQALPSMSDAGALDSALKKFKNLVSSIPRSLEFMEGLSRWLTILSARKEPTIHLVRSFLFYTQQFLDTHLDEAVVGQLSELDRRILLDLDDAIDQYFFGATIPGAPGKPKRRMSSLLLGNRKWREFFLYRVASILGVFNNVIDVTEVGWNSENNIVDELTRVAIAYVPSPKAAVVQPPPANAGGVVRPIVANPLRQIVSSVPSPANEWERQVRADAEAFFQTVANIENLDPTKHWYKDFWEHHKQRFPIMWQLTRVILGTPASSVPVESLFSVMKSVDVHKRASLTTKRLGDLTLANMIRFMQNSKESPAPPAPSVAKPTDYVPGMSLAIQPTDEEIDRAAYERAVAEDRDEPEAEDEETAAPPPAKRPRHE